MVTVHLHNLHFNSFHGVHDEEKILGNEYLIDASVEFHEEREVITSIQGTINYEDIYDIIKERMSMPTPLLETIVMEIGNEIMGQVMLPQPEGTNWLANFGHIIRTGSDRGREVGGICSPVVD